MATLEELEAKYFPAISGVIPHKANTEVSTWVDGEAFYAAIQNAIAATEGPDDRIYFANWLFKSNTRLGSKSIIDLLLEKAKLNVDIRVIAWTGRLSLHASEADPDIFVDEWLVNRTINNLFSDVVSANIGGILSLREATIPPSVVPPLEDRALMDWAGDYGSRHQKYVVVYRKSTGDLRAFAGMDISQQIRNPYRHPNDESPHEVGVELRGEAVRSVWRDFKTRWDEVKSLPPARFKRGEVTQYFNLLINETPVPDPSTAIVTPVTSTKSVRIVRSYDEVKDTRVWGSDLPWTTLPPQGVKEVLPLLQKAVPAARKYIYIECQGLNNNELFTAHLDLWPLLIQAIANGAKVIGVTSGENDSNQSLAFTIWEFFLNHLGPRLTNFVMYRVDKMEVHSKVILIDDEFASIGSANFWDRSMDGSDTELNVMTVDASVENLVKDLRVRLWADHLRVDPAHPTVRSELLDLDKSLAIFRPRWGTGVSFDYKDTSKLKLIGPPHPPLK